MVEARSSGARVWAVPSKLAMMMFLQYFGLGAWVVPLTRYLPAAPEDGGLGFAPTQVGYVFMTLAIGGMLAPFIVGLLADRWFAAEKVMIVSHVAMAVLLGLCGWWCQLYEGPDADPDAALGLLVVFMLLYSVGCQITLTLTNVICFRNLRDSEGSFGYVRLVGTFGWIVGAFVAGIAIAPKSAEPLYLAAVASLVMAGFCTWLPHTPPKGYSRSVSEVVGLPALQMFRFRAFVVFAIVLFVGNMMNQFYTLFTGPFLYDLNVRASGGRLGNIGPEVVMTLAQWCEMACMAISPLLVKRFGLKRVMALGLLGWVVRNGLLYLGNLPLLLCIGLPMHGFSYAFFGMMGALFVDREAPEHLRAGTQALVTFLSSGPAVLLGNLIAGRVVEAYRVGNVTDWSVVWLVPFVGYVAAFVFFLLLFREPPVARPGERPMSAGG